MRLAFMIICAVLVQGCMTTEVSQTDQISAGTPKIVGPVYELGDLTVEPVPIYQRAPQYPKWERRNGVSANVLVEFVITKEGKTANINVLESPTESLANAVIWAVEDWVFTPGEINNEPVNCIKSQTIPFTFNRH